MIKQLLLTKLNRTKSHLAAHSSLSYYYVFPALTIEPEEKSVQLF